MFDKFLRRSERAWLRRSLTPLMRQLATRLDVVFEEILETVSRLRLLSDKPALANGWFRLIEPRLSISPSFPRRRESSNKTFREADKTVMLSRFAG